MITLQQTVDIPADRRIHLDVTLPKNTPRGQTTVVLTFTPAQTDITKAPVFGCARGQFQMADDFDAPLEDFREYM